MNIQPYTADQSDALQEVLNIAMGQAGDSLARLLDSFIELSVPQIRLIEVTQVGDTITRMVGAKSDVTAVRQAFFNNLRGEAIVLFGENGCRDLADLMGYDGELDSAGEQELLLDVANILVGAVLNGIMEILETELSFSAPAIMAERTPLEALIRPDKLAFRHALLLEVNFSLQDRGFRSHLVMMMAEEAIDTLRHMLDEFMESL